MKQTPFPDQAGRAVGAAGAEQPPLGNVDKGVVEDVVVGLSRVSAAGRQIKVPRAAVLILKEQVRADAGPVDRRPRPRCGADAA